MTCFNLVEVDQATGRVMVDEGVYLETNRPAFERGGRSVAYGRNSREALRYSMIFLDGEPLNTIRRLYGRREYRV
jgi:hypothetical protein